PADDRETVRRFLTPLNAENILFLVEIGWPVSTIFRLYVDSLNGIPNAPTSGGPVRDLVPRYEEFQRVAQRLQAVQDQDFARVIPVEVFTQVGGVMPVKDGTSVNPVEAAKEGYEYRPGPQLHTCVLMKKEHKLVVSVNPTALATPEVQE